MKRLAKKSRIKKEQDKIAKLQASKSSFLHGKINLEDEGT